MENYFLKKSFSESMYKNTVSFMNDSSNFLVEDPTCERVHSAVLADCEESEPIRFSFDQTLSLDRYSSVLDDLSNYKILDGNSLPEVSDDSLYTIEAQQSFTDEDSVSPAGSSSITMPNNTHFSNIGNKVENSNKAFTSKALADTSSANPLAEISNTVNDINTDLNKYVQDLVALDTVEPLHFSDQSVKITKSNTKRMRKSAFQVSLLEEELTLNPTWSKEDMREVSAKSGLDHSQVYKWYWDQQRKLASSKRW